MAVLALSKRRSKGLSTRAARVVRLKDRLLTEKDPKVRASIEAQLVAFDHTYRP